MRRTTERTEQMPDLRSSQTPMSRVRPETSRVVEGMSCATRVFYIAPLDILNNCRPGEQQRHRLP